MVSQNVAVCLLIDEKQHFARSVGQIKNLHLLVCVVDV